MEKGLRGTGERNMEGDVGRETEDNSLRGGGQERQGRWGARGSFEPLSLC